VEAAADDPVRRVRLPAAECSELNGVDTRLPFVMKRLAQVAKGGFSHHSQVPLEGFRRPVRQVLELCQPPSLVTLGHVSAGWQQGYGDGSVHKAMLYGRMKEIDNRLPLPAEISCLFDRRRGSRSQEDRSMEVLTAAAGSAIRG
jgi:hypothetical protein